MNKHILSMALLCAASVATAGPALDRIKSSGTLRLGHGPNHPLIQSAGASPVGFAVDLCNAIADGIKAEAGGNLKVEHVDVPMTDGVAAVASGKVDVLCAPVVPTAAARRQVSFSIPVFASGIGALVRTDASDRLKDRLLGRSEDDSPKWRGNPDDFLRNTTVAVAKDTRAEAAVKKALSEMKIKPRLLDVGDYESGVTAVMNGKANVFFGDRAVMLSAIKKGAVPSELQLIDRQFTFEALAFAMPRGDEDLRLAVDSALSRFFRADAFAATYQKWFGSAPTAQQLAAFRANALAE